MGSAGVGHTAAANVPEELDGVILQEPGRGTPERCPRQAARHITKVHAQAIKVRIQATRFVGVPNKQECPVRDRAFHLSWCFD